MLSFKEDIAPKSCDHLKSKDHLRKLGSFEKAVLWSFEKAVKADLWSFK